VKRLALIIPRYGRDITGGAERLARGFAEEAVSRGWPVEVWTTCASGHFDWANTLSPGPDTLNGIPLIRFPISAYDAQRRAALEARLASQGTLPRAEQYAWLEGGPHSEALYAHVRRHAVEFEAIIALPYANPLVHYAAWVAPEKVLLWPCLHNEPYAYMETVRLLLESVWAVAFNSPEEGQIVSKRLQLQLVRQAVLGAGVSLPAVKKTPASGFTSGGGRRPYLLYVGRLEAGKNLSQLYEYVRRYNLPGSQVDLLVVGQGPLSPPRHPSFDYRGYVADSEMAALMTGALALCQPSLNESFSLTMMESWLAGRPALVSGASAVTRGHVTRSKGGLWFENYDDFAAAVSWLLVNDEGANRMGRNGRHYVQANYTWPAVVDHFARVFPLWQGEHGPVQSQRSGSRR